MREISISCSALALLIQSLQKAGSDDGDVHVRARTHNAQGSGLSPACRPAACLRTEMSLLETPSLWERVLHTASSSHRDGKIIIIIKEKKKKKRRSRSFLLKRQEIGFKSMHV